MTDQNNTLEELVAQYESGVATLAKSELAEAFEARSKIEAQAEDLTSDQLKRVEKVDRALIAKSDKAIEAFDAAETPLASLREKTPRPADEWWWHLDVISPISDYFQAQPPTPTSQLLSWGFTALQVIVLIVALYLIGRNLGWFPTSTPTSAAASLSTPTPAATDTVVPGAFDF